MTRLPMEIPPTYDIAFAPVHAYHERAAGSTLRMIWSRRGLVATVLVLCLAAAGAAFVVMPKKYTGQATVQLDLGQRENTPVSQQSAGVSLEASAIVQGEASIISSRMIARRVVQQLGLENQTIRPNWWQRLTASFSRRPPTTGDPAADRMEAAITAVLSHLKVITDNRSYLIGIHYTASDPTTAAKVANTFAQQYLQRRHELNQNLTGHVTEWLRGQIDSTTAALTQAEQAVVAYRQKIRLVDLGANGETVSQQQLRDLGTQLTAASLARINEESRAARVKQMVAAGIAPSAADIPGSTIIQDLQEQETVARQRLSDVGSTVGSQNPQLESPRAALASIQAALAAQMRNAVTTTQASAAAAVRLEQDLKIRFDALQKQLVSEKANEVELSDLQAKVQTIRQRLQSLSQNYDQALADKNLQLVAGSLAIPADAVPIPSSPKPLVLFGLAVVGGLVIGAFAAVLLERRDRGFRTPEEVSELTGVRCLATLPEVSKARRRKHERQTAEEMMFEENIRAVGTGVGLFGNSQQCRVVLVTSSLPDEGKSTICQSLAQVAANVGHRVLLIDATRSQEIGLRSTIVKETAGHSSVARLSAAEPPGDRFIHRGSMMLSEVFGPDRLDRLIEDARLHFDIVLIDGAPVLLFPDSFLIGRKADTVLHVIHWGKTLKSTVMTALQRLSAQSVQVDAAVLSRVERAYSRSYSSPDQWARYRTRPGFLARLARRRRPTAPPVWSPQPAERSSSPAA